MVYTTYRYNMYLCINKKQSKHYDYEDYRKKKTTC